MNRGHEPVLTEILRHCENRDFDSAEARLVRMVDLHGTKPALVEPVIAIMDVIARVKGENHAVKLTEILLNLDDGVVLMGVAEFCAGRELREALHARIAMAPETFVRQVNELKPR
ncbi:MAG TPA: hypothetical protein VIG74_02805 [Alphaproteobacteria bacterium]